MVDVKFSVPKLSGTNWSTWKVKARMLLDRDDLWNVVEEPIPQDKTVVWKRDDRKAKATLVLLLEDSQLPLVKNCDHAKQVYDALKAYHEKTTRSLRVSLLKKLCATNLPESGDLESHLQEMDDLFDRLDAAGTKLEKDVKICMLLRSLPPSYDGIVTALDSRPDDELTIDTVKSKLCDEYFRRLEREGSSGQGEKAMRSSYSKQNKEDRTCYYCDKPGHIKRYCRKYLAEKRASESSSTGGASGGAKAKAANEDMRFVAFKAGEEKTSLWMIDSGASAHMTSDRSFFTSLREFDGGWITVADGKKTRIMGEGSGVILGVDDEERSVTISLSDVKYVPGLAANLISVTKLAQKKLNVVFDSDGCRVVDLSGSVKAVGFRYSGVYYLKTRESAATASGQHLPNCLHQWHRRLGHRDLAAVERINKQKLATGVKINDCGLKTVCECCLEGKLARLSFPPVTERKAELILDIVHTDLCGPMRTVTPHGNRYVMNIIDDFSRFTVTYLLKSKDGAEGCIKDYVMWTEAKFNRKPKVIRSDGGGEFNNNELRRFYKQEGITPQFTTPYSPQQNGVAERKNRALSEMATCMLIDAGLEKRFWGEAILTSTYLQNRLPSRSVEKTPFELWWGRKPDLSHVRIFGSEAVVQLDGRARAVKFIGYCMDEEGYRFLVPGTNKTIVSRDAQFNEFEKGSSVEFPLTIADKDGRQTEEEGVFIKKDQPEEDEEEGAVGGVIEGGEDKGENDSDGDSDEGGDSDARGDSGNEPPGQPRRSARLNKGLLPRYFQDFFTAGIAASVIVKPEFEFPDITTKSPGPLKHQVLGLGVKKRTSQ